MGWIHEKDICIIQSRSIAIHNQVSKDNFSIWPRVGRTSSISGTLDCSEVGRGFHPEAAGARAQSAECFAWLQRGRGPPVRFKGCWISLIWSSGCGTSLIWSSGCGICLISRPVLEILKQNWSEIRDWRIPKITIEITGLRENLGTLEAGRRFNPEAGLGVLK